MNVKSDGGSRQRNGALSRVGAGGESHMPEGKENFSLEVLFIRYNVQY